MTADYREVVLHRTVRQHEADMLADALEDAGIPFYRRIETPTGLQLSSVEGVVAFGNEAVIIVPGDALDDAREILASLPIDQGDEGGAPREPARPATRAFARGLVVVLLALMGLSLLFLILSDLLR